MRNYGFHKSAERKPMIIVSNGFTCTHKSTKSAQSLAKLEAYTFARQQMQRMNVPLYVYTPKLFRFFVVRDCTPNDTPRLKNRSYFININVKNLERVR